MKAKTREAEVLFVRRNKPDHPEVNIRLEERDKLAAYRKEEGRRLPPEGFALL